MAKSILQDTIDYNSAIALQELLHSLNEKKPINLRTLKIAFHSFKALCDSYPNEEGVPQKAISYLSRLFRFVYAITAEYAEGNASFVERIFQTRSITDFLYGAFSKRDSESKAFFEKYFKEEINVLYSPACFDFLVSGDISREIWARELKPLSPTISDPNKPLEGLNDYINLTQERFDQCIEHAISLVKENKTPFTNFPRIFQFIEFLIVSKAYNFNIEALVPIFHSAITLVHKESYFGKDLDNETIFIDSRETMSQNLKGIVDSVQRLKAEIHEAFLERRALDLLNLIQSDEQDFQKLADFLEINQIRHSPLFNRISPQVIFSALSKAPNLALSNYLRLLGLRYGFSNLKDFFAVEFAHFRGLAQILIDTTNTAAPSLRTHLYFKIQRKAEEILKLIQ